MIQTLLTIANHLFTNKENKPVVYLAGKVTGLNYKDVYLKFHNKQLELEANGFFVLNPCEFIDENEEWDSAMRIAVIMLAASKNICLLPDWHLSTGATLERHISVPLGINSIEI